MRQLIIKQNPDKKGLVLLQDKDFHYLRQVLRVKVGDMLVLRLLNGESCNSTVCKIDDKAKTITLQLCGARNAVVPEPVEGHQLPEDSPAIEYTLFQFIPKPQKLELIVRQATECGVKNIVPVISEYTQKGNLLALQGSKLERLEKIVREARQQSGSPVATKVFEPVDIDKLLPLWEEIKAEGQAGETSHTKPCHAAGFVLSERSDACTSLQQALLKEKEAGKEGKPDKICIVCGNEGGISPQELELLVKKGLFYPIHFSVNILRCETAALYGIAAVQTGV